MKTYEVTLHRFVEHMTTFKVTTSSKEKAEELVLFGRYDEIISDSEIGETEEPELVEINYYKE